jgi:cytochrome c biogenesis protein CcdA
MELAFPWPYTEGEWLAWTSALVTVVLGLVAMLAPRLRLREIGQHPEALAESRGQLGGFYVGIGVAAILFAQPFVYMALGFGWTVAFLGRLLSVLFDGAVTRRNCLSLVISFALAALPLAHVFGYIP